MKIQKIELESRWDGFKIPVEDLPDGPIVFNGKDNWFLTSKQFMSDYKNLTDELEHMLLFGKPRKKNDR